MVTLDPQFTRIQNRAHAATIASLLAAPVLFLIGQALLPSIPEDWNQAFPLILEHRDRLMAARLFTTAGAFLFVPAAFAIIDIIPRRSAGSRIILVGAAFFAVATFFNALSQVVAGYTTWAATNNAVDNAAGLSVLKHLTSGPVTIPLGFWSIPLFALGSIVIAIGFLRSKSIEKWIPVTLIVGTILAAALAGRGASVALTQAPFTIAFIALGLIAWRQTGAEIRSK